MENISFCHRVVEAANAPPDKVAMTLIGSDRAETTKRRIQRMLDEMRCG
jgi:hypothetical protein